MSVAHLHALLMRQAGPLLHTRLQPFLLLRRHFWIAFGDLDPLRATRALDLWPFVCQRCENVLLLRSEVSPLEASLLCCTFSRMSGCGQPERQEQ